MSGPAPEVVVLGSGTLLPDGAHHSAAHYVRLGEVRALFDCGPGTVHGLARYGVAWRELTHLVISHFHTDHVGDLPGLLWAFKHGFRAPRSRPLHLIGPRGTGALFAKVATAFGEFVLDPGFPVEIVEPGPEGPGVGLGGGVELETIRVPHTEESIALRLDGPGLSFGYTGDTGPYEPLGDFFRGVDVLISECAVPDGSEVEIHLTPRQVAEMASVARPRLLVTTHAFPPLDPEEVPDLVRAAGYTAGDVLAGRDGLRIVWNGSPVESGVGAPTPPYD